MTSIFIFLLLLSLIVPVGLKLSEHYFSTLRVGALWITIGVILTAVIISPLSIAAGTAFGRSDALRYEEFWNGYETQAVDQIKTCTKNGSCHHTYKCDPHTVVKTRVVTSTDSKGNTTSRTETYTETEYHSCPYATEEHTYVVKTTLEDYTVARNVLAAEPQRWRAGENIPSNIPRGQPAVWTAAKARIDSGDPGAVTALRNYDNYLLASQSSILKRFSSEIEAYKAEGLLPVPAKETSVLQAVKAYGVNYKLDSSWVNGVMKFNGAFGTELQGDLHVVVAKGIEDPDKYASALNAYWQSKELGRNALSKNALVIVLGTETGRNVSWVRAFTGLPEGNERLLAQIRSDLKGVPLNAKNILGSPRAVIKDNDVSSIVHTDGLLETAVWGPNQFDRTCMVCTDAEDTGSGFSYLSGEIEPTRSAKITTAIISPLFILGAWALIGYMAFNYPNPLSRFKITR